MAKTVGYMITWTTYGTWLQGEKKGYVKNGEVRGENIAIKKDCEKKLEHETVRLGRREKEIVREAIIEAAKRFKQKILAIAVHSNHIHIVCEYIDVPIGIIAGHYKNAGRVALQQNGFQGRVWTTGYDKRFCFSNKELNARIAYVNKHNKN
jgi:REP element-mobilizing transposase RayT